MSVEVGERCGAARRRRGLTGTLITKVAAQGPAASICHRLGVHVLMTTLVLCLGT